MCVHAAAAAAAKSLQSCLTLCDPIDGSPPGSPISGILQARTLEWVAMTSSFVPKYTLTFLKSCSMELVELEEHEGSKPAWGSPLSVGWRILWRPEVGALL